MVVKTAHSSQPEPLSPAEVNELKGLLEKIRDELLQKAKARKEEGVYEISRDDLADEADLASVETAQDIDITLAEQDRQKLTLVERAIRKIEANDGSYGLCEGTDEPIGVKRLRVQPWVQYSLRYQEELEKGRRAT